MTELDYVYPLYVEWMPKSGNPQIAHQLLIEILSTSERLRLTGEEIEEIASELADAVRNCGKHQHTHDEEADAFKTACEQLAMKDSVDFLGEWRELQTNIRNFHKWGGHMPSLVFMPDRLNPKQWQLVIPDSNGDPQVYDIKRKGILEDIIPPPDSSNSIPDPAGVGHHVKPRWSAKRRLKYLARRQWNAS